MPDPHPPPACEVQTDQVRPELVAALSATIGTDVVPATHLPPLWHWLLFLDRAPAASLSADGHRVEGGLVTPPPGLPRRMWAGGRLRFHRPLAIGETVACDRSVVGRRDREGRGGRLHFVTLGLRVTGETLALEEERDLVYRPAATGPVRRGTVPAPSTPDGVQRRVVTPDAVMLFRFSALTFNAHRIHYDLDFCRDVEFYPGLVVHGPLQAILLAGLLRDPAPGRHMRHFSYRGLTPAFAGEALTLEAWCDPKDLSRWHMRSLGPDGGVCMTAEAVLDPTGTAP